MKILSASQIVNIDDPFSNIQKSELQDCTKGNTHVSLNSSKALEYETSFIFTLK